MIFYRARRAEYHYGLDGSRFSSQFAKYANTAFSLFDILINGTQFYHLHFSSAVLKGDALVGAYTIFSSDILRDFDKRFAIWLRSFINTFTRRPAEEGWDYQSFSPDAERAGRFD